ncbi:hypothetical protein HMPREF2086_01781 [Helicobacter macacae MIT 99-5501]|uniref:Methyl-accepting transducer domain-containing protein n=1 Tax=Helicobacter macacae MIT 99-5501 TaxID=1357400 RepID=V8C638_9HELI|nr:methyl-accepting chemotaxis protein [Helicobacter macacae]ETD22470.1 hypothetical protein HMPREF2086_01781 [Helicobacter macacae MIT 99-5501]
MHFLNHFTLKSKIIALTLLPLIACIVLMLMQLKSTQDSLSANKSLSTQIAISAKVSDLIHELQKERGLSAGFLSSRGVKFSSELKSQRNSTDSVLKELKKIASKDLLKGFDLQSGFDALDLLDSTRLNADNSLRGDSPLIAQTIGYYTKTISTLLEAIAKSTSLVKDSHILRLMFSYTNFLYAKESAGLERATGNAMLSSNSPASDAQYDTFVSLLTKQEVYEKAFLDFGDSKDRAIYDKAREQPSFKQVESIRESIKSHHKSGDYGVEAKVWWDTITTKIDILKDVEDKITLNIKNILSQEISSQQVGFWAVLLLDGLAFAISILLCVFVTKNILDNLSAVNTKLDFITSHKALNETIEVKSQDGVGQMAKSVNAFLGFIHKVFVGLQVAINSNKSAVQTLEGVSRRLDSSSAKIQSISEENTELGQKSNQTLDENIAILKATKNELENAIKNAKSTKDITTKINTQVQESMEKERDNATKIEHLAKEAQNIQAVLSMITDIAEQTNLLALNAAIEAARAGEHGRGFAVVADEVRKLAERTQRSVNETSVIIKSILQSVDEINTQMEESLESMQELVNGSQDMQGNINTLEEAINDTLEKSLESSSMANLVNDNVSALIANGDKINSYIKELADINIQMQKASKEIISKTNELNSATCEFKI